ncbi:MAG: hypothetical protein IH626_01700 [Rhodospirillales bacterium]|nr:hypothetical protein [Rhodospirillales bacterium]
MSAPKLTSETKERAFALREKGWSYKRIGDALGVSQGCISWHCLANGIEPANKTLKSHDFIVGPAVMARGNHLVRRFSKEEDATIVAMDMQGASISLIARRVGRRWNSVRGRLMTLARRDERREFGKRGEL